MLTMYTSNRKGGGGVDGVGVGRSNSCTLHYLRHILQRETAWLRKEEVLSAVSKCQTQSNVQIMLQPISCIQQLEKNKLLSNPRWGIQLYVK